MFKKSKWQTHELSLWSRTEPAYFGKCLPLNAAVFLEGKILFRVLRYTVLTNHCVRKKLPRSKNDCRKLPCARLTRIQQLLKVFVTKSVSVIWFADWKMLPCHYRAVHRMTDYTLVLACRNKKQVVNVIWLKVASPRRTNPLIVFARWRQCAFSSKHRLLNPNESTFNRLNSIFLVRWSTQTRSYTLPCVLSLITMNVWEYR